MWVFACGSVRSGSTLHYNLISRIVEKFELGKRIDFYPPDQFPTAQKKYADYNGIKVFKTHKLTPEIALELRENRAIGFFTYRDLRDVIVSLANKSGKGIGGGLSSNGFVENYLNNFYQWQNVSNVYFSRYENFAFDISSEVLRIFSILKVDNANQQIAKDIAIELNINKQKEIALNSTNRQKAGNAVFDRKFLLHKNHINSGQYGQWKLQMNAKEVHKVEGLAYNWLLNNGYEVTSRKLFQKAQLCSWSQNGEDDLIWKYFDKKLSGFVIEVGAFDGVHLSNSLALENLGWDTVCIEPHPKYFSALAANRPNSQCINAAIIGNPSLDEVSFYAEELGLLSGVQMDHEDVKTRYKKRGLEFKEPQRIDVKASTLNSILSELGILPGKIDCVFIDVEGSEIDVLKGFDLEYYNPGCLVVEANDIESENELINYLSCNSKYVKARRLGPNIFFLPEQEDLIAKLNLIKINCLPVPQKHPLGDRYTIASKIIRKKATFFQKIVSKLRMNWFNFNKNW